MLEEKPHSFNFTVTPHLTLTQPPVLEKIAHSLLTLTQRQIEYTYLNLTAPNLTSSQSDIHPTSRTPSQAHVLWCNGTAGAWCLYDIVVQWCSWVWRLVKALSQGTFVNSCPALVFRASIGSFAQSNCCVNAAVSQDFVQFGMVWCLGALQSGDSLVAERLWFFTRGCAFVLGCFDVALHDSTTMLRKDFVPEPQDAVCFLCSISRILYKQFPVFLYTHIPTGTNLHSLRSSTPHFFIPSFPCLPTFCALVKSDCPGEIFFQWVLWVVSGVGCVA